LAYEEYFGLWGKLADSSGGVNSIECFEWQGEQDLVSDVVPSARRWGGYGACGGGEPLRFSSALESWKSDRKQTFDYTAIWTMRRC